MISALRVLGRRFVLMMSSEALQSVFHLSLNLALLHVLSAHDYGIFAITMVMGGVGLNYIRALTGMPASISIGQSVGRSAANGHDVIFGSAAFALASAFAIIVTIVLSFWLGAGAVLGGLFVGLWSLRSHLRTSLFARARHLAVAVGDLSFCLSGAGLTACLLLFETSNILRGAFFVLSLANAIGIIPLLAYGKMPIRLSFRRQIRQRYARQWRQLGWSTISVTISNIQGQSSALLIAIIAGPAAYAPIAAAFIVFVPLRLAGVTLVNMMQPVLSLELSRHLNERIWRQSLAWSAIVCCAGVFYAATILATIPFLELKVFEGTSVYVVLLLAGAIHIVCLLYAMSRTFLEVAHAFKQLALIHIISGTGGLIVVAGLLLVMAPAWSLAGLCFSELLIFLLSWMVMSRLLSRPKDYRSHKDDVPVSRQRQSMVRVS